MACFCISSPQRARRNKEIILHNFSVYPLSYPLWSQRSLRWAELLRFFITPLIPLFKGDLVAV
jgi:hypothetical protein